MGHSPDRAARRDDHSLAISPEFIYRFIHSPKGRKEKLHNYLAQAKSRRGRRARLGQSKPMIPNRVSIHERPAEVKRALPFGYWEGDLMIFSRSGGNALVLTEQKSRFILAAKQTGKKSLPTAAAIKRLFKSMPKQALASITFDNGGEFAATNCCGSTPIFAILTARGRRARLKTIDGYVVIFLAKPSRRRFRSWLRQIIATLQGNASASKHQARPSVTKSNLAVALDI